MAEIKRERALLNSGPRVIRVRDRAEAKRVIAGLKVEFPQMRVEQLQSTDTRLGKLATRLDAQDDLADARERYGYARGRADGHEEGTRGLGGFAMACIGLGIFIGAVLVAIFLLPVGV